MAVLARADASALTRLWRLLGQEPAHSMLRSPESSAVTLRGRMGGGGAAFNLGEATVTRATVRLADGTIGHSAMLGRDGGKARIAALIDALCLDPVMEATLEEMVIAPLREALAAADDKVRGQIAATKVNFFTMVRGED
jgi:alpha-D-ribose 1-methylphosphonate 5-triphosphate synthase subunit PhnG